MFQKRIFKSVSWAVYWPSFEKGVVVVELVVVQVAGVDVAHVAGVDIARVVEVDVVQVVVVPAVVTGPSLSLRNSSVGGRL